MVGLATHHLVDTPGLVARCTVGLAVTTHHRYTTDQYAIVITTEDRITAMGVMLAEGIGTLTDSGRHYSMEGDRASSSAAMCELHTRLNQTHGYSQ